MQPRARKFRDAAVRGDSAGRTIRARGEPGGDNPVITPPEPTDPSKPVNPPGPSEPEDQGMLTAEGENAGGWMVWKSQSSIDLFYNRTGGPAEKIQPGSSGFYRFRLKNTRSKELQITVTLSEDRLHIPLKFTLTPLDAQGTMSARVLPVQL